jgi:hypothetical protein
MQADVVLALLCATALAVASTADAAVSTDPSVRSPAGHQVENTAGLQPVRLVDHLAIQTHDTRIR